MRPRPAEDNSYAELRQALLEFARPGGGRLVYVPNRGNAGDALIASAAWQLFDELPETPMRVSIDALRPGDRVIFPGGGVFIPEYPDGTDWLEIFAGAGLAGLLILPHSIRGNEPVLAQLGEECELFCREWASYEHVSRAAPQCRVRFAHDLALDLDIDRLRARVAEDTPGRLSGELSLLFSSASRRHRRWRRKLAGVTPDASGRLLVFRDDAERTAAGGEQAALSDVSNFYGSDYRDRRECDLISADLLDLLDTATLVETNRLHVGIGAALLGKEVVLHDNSYGKIRAIYEASLSDWPNVRFQA